MAALYKQYMKLLKRWPVDLNKVPDFGHFMRDQIKVAFPKGENSKVVDTDKCLKYYESLDRLASNYYCNKYPVTYKTTSTGLTSEQCNLALSPEVQQMIQKKSEGLFTRIKKKFKKSSDSS